jgi:hypothetical protein
MGLSVTEVKGKQVGSEPYVVASPIVNRKKDSLQARRCGNSEDVLAGISSLWCHLKLAGFFGNLERFLYSVIFRLRENACSYVAKLCLIEIISDNLIYIRKSATDRNGPQDWCYHDRLGPKLEVRHE